MNHSYRRKHWQSVLSCLTMLWLLLGLARQSQAQLYYTLVDAGATSSGDQLRSIGLNGSGDQLVKDNFAASPGPFVVDLANNRLLVADTRTSTAAAPTNTKIVAVSLAPGNAVTTFLTPGLIAGSSTSISAVALDKVNNYLYYTLTDAAAGTSGDQLRRINLDGTNDQLIKDNFAATPGAIVVDLANNRLLVADTRTSTAAAPTNTKIVAVSLAPGNAVTTFLTPGLIAGNNTNLGRLALDKVNNYLYYTLIDAAAGTSGDQLRRINLDGTNDQLIKDNFAATPGAIVVDLANNRLLVADTRTSTAAAPTNTKIVAVSLAPGNAVTTFLTPGLIAGNNTNLNSIGMAEVDQPTVTTAAPASIGITQSTLGGNVTADGGATVTERGVVYSSSNMNPTTANTKVTIGSGTGSFSQVVTGLTANTTYYVRAYAINSAGTAYGTVQTFTTAANLAASITAQTNVLCNGGANGSATVTATGGTTPYQYSWSPSGGTGATASGLTAGNYTVTVTDNNGVTATATANIMQPSAVTTTGSQSNVTTTGGNNGSATVNASGGTGGYTYSWVRNSPSPGSLGQTGATATGLIAGSYTVTVRDANNCPSTRNYTITEPATAAPVMVTPPNGSITNNNFPPFSGTAPAGSTISVIVDGTALGSATTDASGNWVVTLVTPLADGPHTVAATATIAGNTSSLSNTNTFTIDTTPPAAPVASSPANGSTTSDNTPSTSGTATPGTTITVLVDGSVVGTTTANASGNWTYTLTTPLADGTHTVAARATDSAGNTSPNGNTNTFIVDTTPPAAPVVVTPANGSTTSDNTPTYSGTAEPGTTVSVVVDGLASGTTTTNASGNWSFTPSVPKPDGSHAVNALATDGAGNTSPLSNTNTFTIDTTPPPAPVVVTPANGSQTNDNTPTYSGTAESGTTVTVIVDGTPVATTTADASGNWSFTPSTGLANGSHTVKARAADAAGNTSVDSNTNTFTVDTTAPTVVITSSAGASGSTTSTSPIPFTVTFSESVTGFMAGNMTVGNGTIGSFSGSGATYTFSITPTASGPVTVNVPANVATDAAGNGNTAAATPFIITYAAPATASDWTGSVSTDWYTAGNWTNGVPTSSLDANILAGAPRYPVIAAGTATVADFTLGVGATLTMNGGTLDVKGSFVNNGTLAAPGGTVALTSASGQTVGGSSLTRFWNLRVNSGGATLSSPASVQRLLTLNGNLNTGGQTFTLESTPTLQAMVFNNGGVVNGTTTVQRAIDPTLNSGVGYHHYSSPVVSTTVADLATAGFTPVVNPAYNTSATPANVVPFPKVFGYDESRLTSTTNNLDTFSKGWFSPAATSDVLVQGRGYTVNIGASQMVDFVGDLFTGNLSRNLTRSSAGTDGGWQLMGNPYASPLDWSLVAPADRNNLDASMYVYQSTSQYGGQYRAYVNGIGGNPLIPVAGGFWVRVSSGQTAGNLTFRSTQRTTAYTNVSLQRNAADTRPLVQLALQGAGGLNDAAYVYFEQGATAGVDAGYDAVKLPNTTGLNLAALAGSDELAINGLPLLGASQLTVPLAVQVPAPGTYTLQAAQLLNLGGAQAYLRDRQTGTLVDLQAQPSYSFRLSAANAGARFELVLTPQRVLGTMAASLSAQVAVYPNPASKSVFVELPAELGRAAVTAELVDGLGRTVRTQVLPAAGATAHRLALDGLATGVYSLRIATPQGVVVKKLVVE